MKLGDKIRITFHGHADKMSTIATVTGLMKDGCVKAIMEDQQHPLALIDGRPRELSVSPDNYEAV